MVNKGSIIKVDFSAWTTEGKLFDTTHRDIALESGSYNPEVPYEPLPVVVGVGRVIPGFDRALLEAAVGEEREVVIPAADAFGERDPAKVETHSMREFYKQEVQPYPGMRVQLQGRTGTIASITAGRVRVDFNPPLAGKDLRYKFKIVEEVADAAEKAKTLVDLNYGQGRSDGFSITAKGTEIDLKLPDSCKYDQRWFIAKYRLVADLRNHAGFKTIRFIEEYETPEETHTHADGSVHPGPAHDEPGTAGGRELVEEEMI